MAPAVREPSIRISVEFAPELFYKSYFLRLEEKLVKLIPDCQVSSELGRPGAYEVTVNGRLVYSKLDRGFFPKQHEVLRYCDQVVKEGQEPEVVPPFDYILCSVM